MFQTSKNGGLLGIRLGVWLGVAPLALVLILTVALWQRGTSVSGSGPVAVDRRDGSDMGSPPQLTQTAAETQETDTWNQQTPVIPLPSGDANGLTLRFGGTVMTLPADWMLIDQPATFFVQQRAASPQSNITVSAGAIKTEMPVKYFVALGVAGIASGLENGLQRTAKLAQISVEEMEKLLESEVGRRTMEQLKSSYPSVLFDLLGTSKLTIGPLSAFEVRSKLTYRESGQTFYSREFVYAGEAAQEIVMVTYASSSEDILKDPRLVGAIHPAVPASPLNDDLTQQIIEENGGFSYTVPPDWIRIPNKNRNRAPKTQFDRVKGPNLIGYPAGMITALGWETGSVDAAIQATVDALRKEGGKSTRPKITAFSTTQGIPGKRLYPAHDVRENQFATIYAFKLDQNRVVTFLCWPSIGEGSDLLSFYDKVMSTMALVARR